MIRAMKKFPEFMQYARKQKTKWLFEALLKATMRSRAKQLSAPLPSSFSRKFFSSISFSKLKTQRNKTNLMASAFDYMNSLEDGTLILGIH